MNEFERKKVLVVDDEPLMANTLSLILNQKGFEATAVYSGEMALAVVDVLKPDVLIVDVTMEDMNGIQAAMRICERVPHCRVFLISGRAVSADELLHARSKGLAFEFLARPIHPTVFLDRLAAQPSCV
ncbi:MAG TPA: response regulator [Terracidiphilus sp.]|jgi:CheY-like chemotaxis protein